MILFSECGALTYKLIRKLVIPAKPSDKSFIMAVQDQHHSRPSAIMQRLKFNMTVCLAAQSVCDCIDAELRHLIEFCEFGSTLVEMLCDHIVCSIGNSQIQCHLLSELALTFVKAFKLAQAIESAEENASNCSHLQPFMLWGNRLNPCLPRPPRVHVTDAGGSNCQTLAITRRPLTTTMAKLVHLSRKISQ